MLIIIHAVHIFSISGYSHVEFGDSTTELRIARIFGDKTGWLYIRHQQILRAEYVEGVQSHLITSVNLDLDKNTTLHAPLNMTVAGTTLNLRGRVTFNNLIVEKNGLVNLYPTSYTATFSIGAYHQTSAPGQYQLGYLGLKHGSTFNPVDGLNLLVATMEMKRFVILVTDYVKIQASSLTLERGAELNVVGRGRVEDAPTAGHGKLYGGGSYASEGGVGDDQTLSAVSSPYGTLYKPTVPGSPGGNGAKGGGYIHIASNIIHLDGFFRASGGDSSSGGGGSGGSIYVVCYQVLKGLGTMEANGGSVSSNKFGAGSGGRIAMETEVDLFSDNGGYSAAGGTSTAPNGRGGPGSVYIKSGKDRNIVETLIIDNSNGQKEFYALLDETNTDLKFDVVQIKNYAKLQIIEDGKARTLTIDKVRGDGTGLLRMKANQKGTLERNSATFLNSKLEINLELHNGGEFILSETTTILGGASVALDLDGILRGVVNLILGPGRYMRMGRNAMIVPFKVTALSGQARVTFGLLQLDPGSRIDYDKDTGADMLLGTLNAKFKSTITADYFNITCSKVLIELEALMSSASPDRAQSQQIDVYTGQVDTDHVFLD